MTPYPGLLPIEEEEYPVTLIGITFLYDGSLAVASDSISVAPDSDGNPKRLYEVHKLQPFTDSMVWGWSGVEDTGEEIGRNLPTNVSAWSSWDDARLALEPIVSRANERIRDERERMRQRTDFKTDLVVAGRCRGVLGGVVVNAMGQGTTITSGSHFVGSGQNATSLGWEYRLTYEPGTATLETFDSWMVYMSWHIFSLSTPVYRWHIDQTKTLAEVVLPPRPEWLAALGVPGYASAPEGIPLGGHGDADG